MDSFINVNIHEIAKTAQDDSPRRFHERLPDYLPSRLTALPAIAKELGIAELWVKDESARMGLPSFKILGASWATFNALEKSAGGPLGEWRSVEELGEVVRRQTTITRLSTATDGNHGRAVARVARWLGLEADIFVPVGTAEARIEAIQAEGASVEVINGSYMAAVERAADEASDKCLVISDTSWDGYEDVPRWVTDGYSTIFDEAAEQLLAAGAQEPTTVAVQMGVGALAAGVVRHYRQSHDGPAVSILGVEPESAACLLKSMREGTIASVPGPHPSIMAGLNCDTPSTVAWPEVSQGVNVFVSIEDDVVRDAMRRLAVENVVSGETGAAGLAGVTAAAADPRLREALGLTAESRVLVLSTEGATDPVAYESIVGSALIPTPIAGS